MSAGSLIARKSIRARWGRTLAIALAITASVSFVVGSFVLADSLRKTFDDLFADLGQDIDLVVRSSQEFDTTEAREPVDVSVIDTVAAVEGVDLAEGVLQRYAQVVDSDGEVIPTNGAPTFGISWLGEDSLDGITLKGGTAPSGPDEVALDKATADRADFALGDQITYVTDLGPFEATLVGLVGLGSGDSFGGAQLVAMDFDTALERLDSAGKVDTVDVRIAEGADPTTVQAAVQAAVQATLDADGAAGLEVVTGEQVAEETADDVNEFVSVFGTGLLIFAFVTAFVSAFIINNVFQITIGQRLRELALLRAIGASGRQVRRMITLEAFGLGVVATVLGIGGGVLVARLLVAAFDAAGAGFPDTPTVLAPRTIVMAALVGIGITMVSVIVPARRAANIPPVAAMRPELGFAAMSAKRLIGGAIVTAIGAAMFVYGLFVRPGGTTGLIALAGGGALVLFVGVASLSSTVAGPVSRAIGWPVQKLFKVPGTLARENVARSPRRTASSASALMIGVALVSCAAVFASSLRSSLVTALERSINADVIISDPSFQGLSPAVSESLVSVPEVGAVSPVRGASGQVDGETKALGAVDPVAFEQLVDPDLQEGTIADLGLDELLINDGPADQYDLELGSTIDVTFQSGQVVTLTVAGIYGDATFGEWLISLDTLSEVTAAPARDFFVLAKYADGVDPGVGLAAVKAALEPYPQADVQTTAEFQQANEDQINQLLIVISLLLAFAIVIAVMGISITLALGVFERTREIGLLRAVGMNRRQTRRSVRWEAVIVSTFGAIVGIVVGTFMGIVLTLAVPDDFIGELAFSPTIIVTILVLAVVAGLAAALYPSYKASNMNVLEAIATE